MEPSHDEAIDRLNRIYQARVAMNAAAANVGELRRQLLAAQGDYREKRAAWELLAAPDPEMPLCALAEGNGQPKRQAEEAAYLASCRGPAESVLQAQAANGEHSATSLPIAHFVKRDPPDPMLGVLSLSPETQRQLELAGVRRVSELDDLATLTSTERSKEWKRLGIPPVQGATILKMLGAWKAKQARGNQ